MWLFKNKPGISSAEELVIPWHYTKSQMEILCSVHKKLINNLPLSDTERLYALSKLGTTPIGYESSTTDLKSIIKKLDEEEKSLIRFLSVHASNEIYRELAILIEDKEIDLPEYNPNILQERSEGLVTRDDDVSQQLAKLLHTDMDKNPHSDIPLFLTKN